MNTRQSENQTYISRTVYQEKTSEIKTAKKNTCVTDLSDV